MPSGIEARGDRNRMPLSSQSPIAPVKQLGVPASSLLGWMRLAGKRFRDLHRARHPSREGWFDRNEKSVVVAAGRLDR